MTEQPVNAALSREHPGQVAIDERALAEEIVSVLTSGPRVCLTAEATIRYSVRGSSVRLRSIVFDRVSLRHLLRDRDRAVKVEYLQRDLLRCAADSTDYRYP